MIFDISALSGRFTVRRLKDADVPAMLALAKTNEVYYRYHAPAASSEVFWAKNGFIKAGEEYPNDHSACLPMERLI